MAKKKSEAGPRTPRSSAAAGLRDGVPDKVIRDSYTMPRGDYELIATLKQRCIGLGFAKSKSELLRAGLGALNHMPDAALAQVVAAVESVKTGRPPGAKKKRKRKKSRRSKGKNK
jgi:hypothetical protein